MGVLIFTTGCSYVLITRYTRNIVSKAGYAMAIGTTFLLIWSNLAVGLIGGGPHLGNLMSMAVVAVAIIGIILSRFTAAGMEKAMYATAFTLVILAVIALLANIHEYPGSPINEIIAVNGFFILLYVVTWVLFRYVDQTSATAD